MTGNPWMLPVLGAVWVAAGLQQDVPMLVLATLMAPIFVGAARQDYLTTPNPFLKIG